MSSTERKKKKNMNRTRDSLKEKIANGIFLPTSSLSFFFKKKIVPKKK